MDYNQSEYVFETERLAYTITIAEYQLNQARQKNVENKLSIFSAKKELREETSHSISNLWGAEGFEALAELNQFVSPMVDKIKDYEELEKKVLQLESLIKSPYFARIDFKYDDEDLFEKIYIGKTSLMKDKSYEMIVHDWRSPIASVFYRFVMGRAHYNAPAGKISGEVNLKRQYEINHSVLEYYFDADVQIIDEFLRKLLSQNTSCRMKTIVETIQKEQDIVIRDMENDLMMVQGVAGSGKTSIALHRAAYLMYQGLASKLSANNIIIISPNSLFEQYISGVLPELGENNVASMVFDEMMATILKTERIQSKNQFLEDLITSPRYRKIIKNSIEFKTSERFKKLLDQFIIDIPNRWIDFDDIYYGNKLIISKEQLRDFVNRRCDIPIGARLKRLEEYIMELVRESVEEPISRSDKSTNQKNIQKFTDIDALGLYYKLFCDKEYFHDLIKDYELYANWEEIRLYTIENANSHNHYFDDAIALTYLKLIIFGTNEFRNIKQVVIDEAQDYYPLQYEIFHLLFQNAKLTILGDINQTLEKQEDNTLYEKIRKILNKKKASLITMEKSFRCTNEILQYGLKFIDRNLDIKNFNRKGEEPQVFTASSQASLIELIIEEIRICRNKEYRTIGLICKSEKKADSLYRALNDRIEVQLIKNESTTYLQGVFIIPVYLSKGLEFDAVLISDVDAVSYQTEEDKRYLYIACTRALHRLNLFCKGESSRLL